MNSGQNHLVTKIEIYILDLICFIAADLLAVRLRNVIMGGDVNGNDGVLLLLVMAHTLIVIMTNPYHRFLVRDRYSEISKVLQHIAVTFVTILLLGYLVHIEILFSRLAMGIMLILDFIFMYPARVICKKIRRRKLSASDYMRSIIVITTSDRIDLVLGRIETLHTYDYSVDAIALVDGEKSAKYKVGDEIQGIPVVADKDSLLGYITSNPIDEALLSIVNNRSYEVELAETLLDMGLSVDADIEDRWEHYPNARLVCLGENNHILAATHSYISDTDALIKRGMDIVGGLVGILVCGILTILVGPFIFFSSPGPIFFKQTRVGLNGRKFTIYKFRSMYMDAEERKQELMAQNEMGGHMFKMADDPRIIKGVGHFIRNTSIDEFPQFVNVLKGDMSLVGTRPPTEDEYEKYEPHHKARLSMKPGLTGLWQVSGRSAITDFDEVVKLDKAYIMNWSLKKDFEIILKTVKVVLLRNGAR